MELSTGSVSNVQQLLNPFDQKELRKLVLFQHKNKYQNKYYVYKHYVNGRLFYIGKGCGYRAWSDFGRNTYWHNTVNKYGGYDVELSHINLSEDESLYQEYLEISKCQEFAKLVNLTTGGSNPRFEPAAKAAMSCSRKGVPLTSEHRYNLSQSHLKSKYKPDFSLAKNPNVDANSYVFIRDDGLIFEGTRVELATKFDLKLKLIQGLFSARKRKSSQGWSLLNQTVNNEQENK